MTDVRKLLTKSVGQRLGDKSKSVGGQNLYARLAAQKDFTLTTVDAVVPLRGVDDAATLKIRCDRCQKAFGKTHWTKLERNHRKYYQTKLVCQACRADGFHAWNLRAYPCHMCAGMFGSKRYDAYKLQY